MSLANTLTFTSTTIIQYRNRDKNMKATTIQLRKITSTANFTVTRWMMHENAIVDENHISSVLPYPSTAPLSPYVVVKKMIAPWYRERIIHFQKIRYPK